MSFADSNPYASPYGYAVAAHAETSERAAFIRRTYLHLALAVGAFIVIETAWFTLLPAEQMQRLVATMSGMGWLVVLGLFFGASWVADNWARSATSLSKQYAGLGLFVAAESIVFLPLLYFAQRLAPQAIPMAAAMTALIFTGLTMVVFLTRADFSGLGRYLWLGFIVAVALIVCSFFFHTPGLSLFIIGLVLLLACGYILYHTSNVLHHYRVDQHVSASLALFASVALLFYYVLMLFMNGRD